MGHPADPGQLNFDIHTVLRRHDTDGLFVAVDGFDGTGKSTLVELIAAHLGQAGREVVSTRSPQRETLDHPLYQSYLYRPESRAGIDYRGVVATITGARLQHAHEVVWPALRRGAVVVTDRYVYSAVAHSYSRGLRSELWFRELCRYLPRPDFGFILDAKEATIRARLSSRPNATEAHLEEGHFQACLYAYRNIARAGGLTLVETDGPVADQSQRIISELGRR